MNPHGSASNEQPTLLHNHARYDGDGQRVKKSGGTLYWRDANGSVLAETDTSGNTLNEYIFFGGRIARRDSSGNVYYYFANALGSASITNATGGLCYDADFYPFGGELAFTNTCSQSYKFAAMEQDSETGDYHTWFRQYSPSEVRWLSPDPLGGNVGDPQSFNRYSYAENNPCNLTDPLGLSTCALDIKLQNKAGSTVDLGPVEDEINAILSKSSDGQPNTVTANFVTSGKADYTVNIVNGNPNSNYWGSSGFWFFSNPSVNAAAIGKNWGAYENLEVGETALHELTHRITGWGDLKYNGGPDGKPNPYMLQENDYGNRFKIQAASVFEKPLGVILNPTELAAFYKKCIKKHGRGPGSGGGSNALPTNTGTETLWSCSTHYYWSEEPGTSTTCSPTWSFGYGFRGFIL
ncbi:MAG TPA: RHS repeat-associated core domain-containing protein [Candidatus Sulfotelmatobacter sp.]|nr:RHS repeat-associated core domain-containing protein [Candidatus Sulfotelmatobacter sp.]